jgi:hypothetical protein
VYRNPCEHTSGTIDFVPPRILHADWHRDPEYGLVGAFEAQLTSVFGSQLRQARRRQPDGTRHPRYGTPQEWLTGGARGDAREA